MKILAVNAGSSSLKFQMYEMPEEKVLISGVFERIGIDNSFYTIKLNGEKIRKEVDLSNHSVAVGFLTKELLENNIVESLEEIKGVGHRIVQGADKFDKTVVVDDMVEGIIGDLSALAPLHNPAALVGIKAFKEFMPNAVHTAVFDTAFHQTMPEEAYMYALPYEWYTKYSVRKYGAHGTSHKYVSQRVNEILGRTDTKVIVCHLGNGGSISAVLNGKCIDTSMGFTPNAGVIMGSRCGDIDASILPYVMNITGMTPSEMDTAINKKSGLLGVSGVSSDARDVEQEANNGNKRCILAEKMYNRRVIEYIAKYYVLLGGADAICFTAGLGENAINTRKEIMEGLRVLGVKVDEEANNVRGVERLITTKDSSIPCYLIPTNEEVMIARDTYNLVLDK
ncbi:acetate kinase 1 [Clostridium sp. CAG:1193]|jgi:acetate kinase|nr:acetate kinase 1 [Clostridium sp. CAG:1193]